jgi:hypothetical protein
MKNIYLIPTDKPSRLFLNKVNKKIILEDISNPNLKKVLPSGSYQHIYITSDEIKGFDWCYDKVLNIVFQTDNHTDFNYVNQTDNVFKIILTTDPQLIANGIQEIDDEFLQWYVKNPSCEYVEVNEKLIIIQDKPLVQHQGNKPIVVPHRINYKIIIPKEEPKPIHQQIIDIVGGEDRFKEIAGIKPKQKTLKKVEENIDREEWIHFFKNNSKEEILEYLIKYKFPL